MKRYSIYLLALCTTFALTAAAQAQGYLTPGIEKPAPQTPDPDEFWTEAMIEQFGALPIQDGGRVKPISTYARFKLVKLSGRTTYKREDGSRMSAARWLLDALFFPETAAKYKVFRIENPQVMQTLGLKDAWKRSYFSYRDLQAAENALYSHAQRADGVEEKERTLFQNQILTLFDQYLDYQYITHGLEFARRTWEAEPGGDLARAMKSYAPELDRPRTYAEWLGHLPLILTLQHSPTAQLGGESAPRLTPAAMTELQSLLGRIESIAQFSRALTIFPPTTDMEAEAWLSPGSLLQASATGAFPRSELMMLAQLERLPASIGDRAAFSSALEKLVDEVASAAKQRGEGKHIATEIFFYNLNPFRWSLALFILSFLIVAVSWMAPRRVWLGRIAWASALLPTLLLIVGITLRCIIRGRPPITNLYETTLFVPAVAIVTALTAEWINRKKVALAIAVLMGVGGLFLANIYELKDGQDTMGSLVAVLNSNFWLATHVTTITIGYSAGLLAAALAHLYLFARVFRRNKTRNLQKTTAQMIYGVLAFCAIFSFLGTVLGGIWANYSWGRFWGWDPKENGALLIILWTLIILHGRLGGYLADFGTAMAAVAGGMVVAFSWWGVNLLGVGLHSYGFISGIMNALMTFYIIEALVLLIGFIGWLLEARSPLPSASAVGGSGVVRGSGKTGSPNVATRTRM